MTATPNASPGSPPEARPSARVRIAMFGLLLVMAVAAVRLAEYGRSIGLPWHGFVRGWYSFMAVAAITTAAALLGAKIGMRNGGRVWCLLLAATMGGIAAAPGNSVVGAIWGLIVGAAFTADTTLESIRRYTRVIATLAHKRMRLDMTIRTCKDLRAVSTLPLGTLVIDTILSDDEAEMIRSLRCQLLIVPLFDNHPKLRDALNELGRAGIRVLWSGPAHTSPYMNSAPLANHEFDAEPRR